MKPQDMQVLEELVGSQNVISDAKRLTSGSKDCYYFSPVLKPQLDGCLADAIVRPEDQEQLIELIAWAAKNRIPITPRGAGTGNYGQGVPLRGGIMINTRNLNQIVSINKESARVEAGVILLDIENQAASHGAELRCFPSTVPTSHTGGFITGGSGGIGSIEWGLLREKDNVKGARIITVEEKPRVLDLERKDLDGVLHNCGLTCFVAEVTLGLAPKTRWHQYVLSYDDFYSALSAGKYLAQADEIKKRLVTVFEWPVPTFFAPLHRKDIFREGSSVVFLYTDLTADELAPHIDPFGGEISYSVAPALDQSRGTQIYDYTWNHTTQWAMKKDKGFTYLQDRFDIDRIESQIKARKAKFPEMLEHVEFIRDAGKVVSGGLSLLQFSTEDRLKELINYCEDNDIRVANPHTHYLDDDTRWYGDAFLKCKAEWDPYRLLNPGHLHAHERDPH